MNDFSTFKQTSIFFSCSLEPEFGREQPLFWITVVVKLFYAAVRAVTVIVALTNINVQIFFEVKMNSKTFWTLTKVPHKLTINHSPINQWSINQWPIKQSPL